MTLTTDYSISAAVARKSTEENIRSNCEEEIKLIRSKINNAVSQCEFYVSDSGTLKNGTQKWLNQKVMKCVLIHNTMNHIGRLVGKMLIN